MYTSEQCLEKLKTARTHEVLPWKLEYEAALAREQTKDTEQEKYADLLKALTSNTFARSNQDYIPKKIKAFDELEGNDESIEIEDFITEPVTKTVKQSKEDDCESCNIVKKRRSRKVKGE